MHTQQSTGPWLAIHAVYMTLYMYMLSPYRDPGSQMVQWIDKVQELMLRYAYMYTTYMEEHVFVSIL